MARSQYQALNAALSALLKLLLPCMCIKQDPKFPNLPQVLIVMMIIITYSVLTQQSMMTKVKPVGIILLSQCMLT